MMYLTLDSYHSLLLIEYHIISLCPDGPEGNVTEKVLNHNPLNHFNVPEGNRNRLQRGLIRSGLGVERFRHGY